MLIQLQLGDQKCLHDHHAFSMNVAAQLRFALNIHKLAIAGMNHAGNTRGIAPGAGVARIFHHRQAVNLTNYFAFGFNQNLSQQDLITHPFIEIILAPQARFKRITQRFGIECIAHQS